MKQLLIRKLRCRCSGTLFGYCQGFSAWSTQQSRRAYLVAMNPAPTLLQVPVIPAPRPVLTAPDDSRLALVMWTKVADVSLSAAIDVSAVECSRSTSLCFCCRGLRPLRIAIYGDLQLRMMPRGLMCFHWERTVAIYQSGSRALEVVSRCILLYLQPSRVLAFGKGVSYVASDMVV